VGSQPNSLIIADALLSMQGYLEVLEIADSIRTGKSEVSVLRQKVINALGELGIETLDQADRKPILTIEQWLAIR
jgi:hypothetical protein